MQKLDFPNRITVELTNQCNVSCTFCPRQKVPMQIGCMDFDLYKKIIDEASEHLPVKLVIFFRGESLLHPQFIECLSYAKKRGIGPVQFASNALALTPDIAEQMLEADIDFISFSLDTLDECVYNRTRATGNLNKSIENVIALSDMVKKRRNEGKSAPTLQVSTIKIPDYVEGHNEFVEFWKKYVDIVRVYYEHDDNGRFRDPEVEKELPQMEERCACRKIFTDFLIYWDGRLALCNYDWRGGLAPLNVNNMSIMEAWNSETYEQVRRMHNENTFDDSNMCKNCQHWRIDYMPKGFLGESYKGNVNDDK